MVFGFFKSKRSAHSKTKCNSATVAAGPLTNGDIRPSLYPNPLALNPPNRLHFTPEPKGQQETTRIISGDLSATADLSHLISQADRLAKLAPELNLGGLVATQRLLKTGGCDARELLADQARAEQRLRSSRNRVLPVRCLQVSEVVNNSIIDKNNNNNIVVERWPAANTSCDACKAGLEKCSACYKDNSTKTSFPSRHNRNSNSGQLARLDKRPDPQGHDFSTSASICTNLVDTFPIRTSDDTQDEDDGEICQLSHSNFGVVHSGARIIDIGSANGKCCSTIVRFAIPFDSPRYYSLPSAGLPRPDSPTLPVEFPAPLFSNRI